MTYVLLSGASPFLDESLEETCLNICRLDFSFPEDYFQSVSTEAKDFVCLLLQGEPERRPSAGFCLQYPWLQPQSVACGGYGHVNHTQPPSPIHYSTHLDTSRLISFIERRKHQNDVRPVGTIKAFLQSRLYNHTWHSLWRPPGTSPWWSPSPSLSHRSPAAADCLTDKPPSSYADLGIFWYASTTNESDGIDLRFFTLTQEGEKKETSFLNKLRWLYLAST